MFHNLYIGVGVVLLFGAAIFVHEFGHYWMARRRGLKIEAFAIGFGPKIFSWTRDGIEYSLRWIPAGGFVKLPQMVTGPMEGDMKTEQIPPAAPFSKILVAVAGPAMNVVFAFAIATLIYYIGLPMPVNPSIIGHVEESSAEAKLGIREGDRIVAVDGKPVRSWDEVYQTTALALSKVLPVEIARDGKTNTYTLRTDVNPMLELKALNLEPFDRIILRPHPNTPAAAAHLVDGDELVSFAGVPVSSVEQLTNLVQKRSQQDTAIVVLRGTNTMAFTIRPELDATTKRAIIGVGFGLKPDDYVVEHPTPWAQVKGVVEQIGSTVSALAHSHESGVKASDLSGPVGIIGALATEVKTDYRRALSFLVLLNINLAIINLLPVPVLDGGHILMAVIERIRRRPMALQFVEFVNTGFAVLLIGFMGYVTYYDVGRLPLLREVFRRDAQIEQAGSATPEAASATNSSR